VWILVDAVTFGISLAFGSWSWEARLRRRLGRTQKRDFNPDRETLPFTRN